MMSVGKSAWLLAALTATVNCGAEDVVVAPAVGKSDHDDTHRPPGPSRSRPRAKSASAPADSNTIRLRVVTYNAYLMQFWADWFPVDASGQSACRAPKIGSALAAMRADIIGLTETFHTDYAADLAQAIDLPHKVVRQPAANGDDWGIDLPANGGLSLLTRDPHTVRAAPIFPWASCTGADCIANKGFIFATVDLGQIEINLVLTHLNAGLSAADRAGRALQLRQIKEFLQAQSDVGETPTLLIGDLNVNAIGDEEYAAMIATLSSDSAGAPRDAFAGSSGATGEASRSTLNCVDGLYPCSRPGGEDPQQRLDYLLYFAGAGARIAIRAYETHALADDDSECNAPYLSDHKAILVDLEIAIDPSGR